MVAPKKKTTKKTASRSHSRSLNMAGERIMLGVIVFTLLSVIFLLMVMMKYA